MAHEIPGAPAPEPRPSPAAEPAATAQPAHPAAEARVQTAAEPRRRFIDRRPSRGPMIATAVTAAVLGGVILFHEPLGQATDNLGSAMGLGRDGSSQATPTANSAAAGNGEAKAGAAPTTAPATAKALSKEELQKAGNEAHTKRLAELDPKFRQKGTFAWLVEAGFSFKGLSFLQEARQVEEETLTVDGNTRILASGVQVDVTGLDAPWPNALTTSDPSVVGKARVCVQPDPSNPSRLCTDVKGFSGKATLYVDAQNWAQLAPKK